MSDTPLDRTIEDLEPAILDRWSARLADTGLAPHPSDVPDRAGLRALLAEVREELRAAPSKAVRSPLRLQGTAAALSEPLLRPRDLLALSLGPEAVRFLEKNPDTAYVYKPDEGETFDTWLPQCDADAEANLELRQHLRTLTTRGAFVLQERKDGVETNVEVWFVRFPTKSIW